VTENDTVDVNFNWKMLMVETLAVTLIWKTRPK